MKHSPLYILARRWSSSMLKKLAEKLPISGIILGDLFCQKRMFEYADFSLSEIARQARELNLQIIFQTPLYLTSKNFEQTFHLISYLSEANLVDGVFLHDIGLLQRLKNMGRLNLWWDRYSYNRDIVVSEELVSFLTENGISSIEVTRISDVDTVIANGNSSLINIYSPKVISFGRICYTEYFLGSPCKSPHILCDRDSLPVIVSTDGVFAQYAGDGFTLVDQNKSNHHIHIPKSYRERPNLGLLATISSLDDIESLLTLLEQNE